MLLSVLLRCTCVAVCSLNVFYFDYLLLLVVFVFMLLSICSCYFVSTYRINQVLTKHNFFTNTTRRKNTKQTTK